MENKEYKNTALNLKSHILLPVIFVLTLAIGICFLAVDNFNEDLNNLIVWVFFVVCLTYVIVSIIDTFISKEKSKKQVLFIRVMAVLAFLSTICYLIFYFIS